MWASLPTQPEQWWGAPDYDAELIGMLESTVGCPAITTAGAAVAALTQAATKKLALLTPYPK